jgi:hypothetical protein
MRHAPTTLRLTALRLAAPAALLAFAAAPAGAATWRLEPIADTANVAELHELSFDAQGRGLLSWNGAQRDRVPPVFGGLATRDPGGDWARPTDLRGISPATMQIGLFGTASALLVAREDPSTGSRRRLIVADGQSDGGFDTFASLGDFAVEHWSAANARGDAIVAWTAERSPFLRVAERSAGGRFAPLRELAVGRTAAVAINARGDRLFAWPAGTRVGVRIRRAEGSWSRTRRIGRLPADGNRRLSALVAADGRMLVTWGRDRGNCGVAVGDGRGSWRTKSLERRCGPAAVGPREAPVLPLADSRGALYVAWTHGTRQANSVTLARVGRSGPVSRGVVSRQRGAILDDVAAGPDGDIAVTWAAVLSKENPLLTATYAALRRTGGAFAVQRLSPPTLFVARGSRVAFHPLTGQVVVAIPFVVGRALAVGSAISPRATRVAARRSARR